uniref:Uncharacterized protein n=1 Tax=Rhizophora mucronata TaxID=61149 RepID=A0A2P2Q1Q4_RHIMU
MFHEVYQSRPLKYKICLAIKFRIYTPTYMIFVFQNKC